ncbi:MAG: hypothetical protein LBN12_06255 [Clostridiales Family XIII bacterium]|nr:hypothetical protein [Clostridiales Family XIII bacterium]
MSGKVRKIDGNPYTCLVSQQSWPAITAFLEMEIKGASAARAYRNTLAERPPPQAAWRFASGDILLGLTL